MGRRSRTARAITSFMLVALIAGATGLSLNQGSAPASETMPSHEAKTLAALPSNAREAAGHTIVLTITTPGHVTNVAAMVLAHDLAVTTVPIPSSALLTGSIPSHLNFPVMWVGRDSTMGFSIVLLSVHVPASKFAPLPASASVMAVAPVVAGSTSTPRFAWANTTLGDPVIKANGVVSYLATPTAPNLDGFVDAVAVNQAGQVVAVLATSHLWYSAQFVARVADILASGNGCHAHLGIMGLSAQGGGVLVNYVFPNSGAAGHLVSGDIVKAVNGHDVDTLNSLLTMLYLTPAGSSVDLTFLRHATTHRTVVTLTCLL